MSLPSLIFWLIFMVPLVAGLVWIMRQDKRRGLTGLIVLVVMVIFGIVYMYVRTRHMYDKKPATEVQGFDR